MFKNSVGLTILLIMFTVNVAWSKDQYLYLSQVVKTYLPYNIYQIEKDIDLFENAEAPSGKFKVYKVDLNSDGKTEYIISNPFNNGLYFYFWRIYQLENNKYKYKGEMACTSIRFPETYTDGYRDIECYSYISLVEGFLKTYKYFGNQYLHSYETKINSARYYVDNLK